MFVLNSHTEATGERLMARVNTLPEVKRGLKDGVRRLREHGYLEGLDGFDRERLLWEQIDALADEGGDVGPLPDGTRIKVTVE